MIVSFEHRFLFVAIPKTATHAIRQVLRPRLGHYDWEQCALFERKTFPVAELAQIGHGHLTCEQIKPYLLPLMWSQFLKFCVVRNPFDRFLSFSYFWNRDNDRMHRDPLGTMKALLETDERRHGHGYLPQAYYVSDADGALAVDTVIRYETLQVDFDRLSGLIGLPTRPLAVVNSSKRRDLGESYDDELADMVRYIYAQDFALFGYGLELPAP